MFVVVVVLVVGTGGTGGVACGMVVSGMGGTVGRGVTCDMVVAPLLGHVRVALAL